MKKSLRRIAAVLISASIMGSLLSGCSIKELILKDGATEVTPTPSVTPTPTPTAEPTPTASPTPTAEPTPEVYNFGNSTAYVSPMGYQITIPESWNDRYTVENTENGDVFRCRLCVENGQDGTLLTVVDSSKINNATDIDGSAVTIKTNDTLKTIAMLSTGNSLTAIVPGDRPYDMTIIELETEYQDLAKYLPQMIETGSAVRAASSDTPAAPAAGTTAPGSQENPAPTPTEAAERTGGMITVEQAISIGESYWGHYSGETYEDNGYPMYYSIEIESVPDSPEGSYTVNLIANGQDGGAWKAGQITVSAADGQVLWGW
ncbi:MAG: hypothetical protein J6D46_03055 [Lachnospiraceae bacterium]|nr:hypothetical protein [Lachnospiraceae bacterium]